MLARGQKHSRRSDAVRCGQMSMKGYRIKMGEVNCGFRRHRESGLHVALGRRRQGEIGSQPGGATPRRVTAHELCRLRGQHVAMPDQDVYG